MSQFFIYSEGSLVTLIFSCLSEANRAGAGTIRDNVDRSQSQGDQNKLTAGEMLAMLQRYNSGMAPSREIKWGFW